MTFVHVGLMHLLVEVGALVSVGLVLERLLGSMAFAGIYVATALLAGLVSVSAHPMIVSVGASGAIFGLYGLLLSTLIWGVIRRSPVTVPLNAGKILGPPAGLFVLYSLATDNLGGDAQLVGLIIGAVCGLVLARRVDEDTAPLPLVGGLVAATLITAVVMAVPLSGVSDARPEIVRVVAMEDRTAGDVRRRGESVQERVDQRRSARPRHRFDHHARAAYRARAPQDAGQGSAGTAVARRQR